MRITAIFANQSKGTVRAEELQGLLESGEVVSFLRGSEWVKVGVDPIRGMGGKKYRGPERRGDVQFY